MTAARPADLLLLYSELAPWWPLLSPPSDYAEEAGVYAEAIKRVARRPVETLLELGSGGGNNASHLKAHFRLTLLDRSPDMVAVSEALNPELEHRLGDMRTARLGRSFDAVLVHDAVMYMTTEEDLAAAIGSAAAHLAPGGVALFVPGDTAETYRPRTASGGTDGEGRSIRYLEWCHQPRGTSFRTTYVYVLSEGDDPPRVEHEDHVAGLFPRATWLRLITEAGLEPRALPYPLSDFDVPHELFAGVAPAS